MLDEHGMQVRCDVRVYPLLVRRQSAVWPEAEQRLVQWADLNKAISLIEEAGLKTVITAFAKRAAAAASKSIP
jgi:hypothetical protein